MKNDNTFMVEYDDRPDQVVDEIADILKNFGLEIVIMDDGDDPWIEYEIRKIGE